MKGNLKYGGMVDGRRSVGGVSVRGEGGMIRRMIYDECDATLHGGLWVFKCGYMVHDRLLGAELSGEAEERLVRGHRRHHETSIGERIG